MDGNTSLPLRVSWCSAEMQWQLEGTIRACKVSCKSDVLMDLRMWICDPADESVWRQLAVSGAAIVAPIVLPGPAQSSTSPTILCTVSHHGAITLRSPAVRFVLKKCCQSQGSGLKLTREGQCTTMQTSCNHVTHSCFS